MSDPKKRQVGKLYMNSKGYVRRLVRATSSWQSRAGYENHSGAGKPKEVDPASHTYLNIYYEAVYPKREQRWGIWGPTWDKWLGSGYKILPDDWEPTVEGEGDDPEVIVFLVTAPLAEAPRVRDDMRKLGCKVVTVK
jgi:hypothetical protein